MTKKNEWQSIADDIEIEVESNTENKDIENKDINKDIENKIIYLLSSSKNTYIGMKLENEFNEILKMMIILFEYVCLVINYCYVRIHLYIILAVVLLLILPVSQRE